MRTIWDIIVFKPERTVVACTWRSDYTTDLLSVLTAEHCPDARNRWTGAAVWQEIEDKRNYSVRNP